MAIPQQTGGEIFFMVEVPDSSETDWWVVGIFDNADACLKSFMHYKAKKFSVRMIECKVIMEYNK